MAVRGSCRIEFDRTRIYGDDLEAALSKRIRETAFNVEGDAKELCPIRFGHLQGSITTQISSDGLVAEIGTGVDYAEFVELGTRRMRARPYLLPAFEENVRKLRDGLRRDVGDLKP